ncbi:MAG: FecR domain-containing protein [Candidatus Accumulibacter sp.]|uniref:FecR domain-containing protein n=1 Tax=Accumulibacter sp. TaxID=2053492 RepID=UPI001A58259F|nr:FecR domain-containing protein [Accumulibacter sp.]MBL8402866.1 FecR domain-containing protein [Accumulibacter sp.]MBO3710251.1 FecR domain-containing protein [Accumulibacter sp.]MCM8623872.1 FecR domain-containing protein [Accumulibacter sp.]
MNRHCICALFAMLTGSLLPQTTSAVTGADAIVDGVLMPAWLERLGVRQELTPGMVLQNRDRVISGPRARVRIRLGDGSTVGMAADSQLDLNALGVREAQVFTAALDVQQGAVRFSTSAFNRNHRQRAVNLRVGTLTAGIRGTDVLGRVDAESDRICLLEGSIVVLHPLAEALQIDTAPSCYLAPKGDAPAPIEVVTASQLASLAAQTALPAAPPPVAVPTGMSQVADRHATRRGRWVVELATLDSEAATLSLYDRARTAGYPVRIMPRANADSGYDYTVRLAQLPTQSEAAALAVQIAESLQIALPVVVRH